MSYIMKKKIQPIQVDLYCTDCHVPVKFTGEILDSYPPIYIHKCPQCGRKHTDNVNYPYIIYEEVE